MPTPEPIEACPTCGWRRDVTKVGNELWAKCPYCGSFELA